MRGDQEFLCVNAYEKLGSIGARVCPVLSPFFITLVNKTTQIYIMQIEMSQGQFSEYILSQPRRKTNSSWTYRYLENWVHVMWWTELCDIEGINLVPKCKEGICQRKTLLILFSSCMYHFWITVIFFSRKSNRACCFHYVNRDVFRLQTGIMKRTNLYSFFFFF